MIRKEGRAQAWAIMVLPAFLNNIFPAGSFCAIFLKFILFVLFVLFIKSFYTLEIYYVVARLSSGPIIGRTFLVWEIYLWQLCAQRAF